MIANISDSFFACINAMRQSSLAPKQWGLNFVTQVLPKAVTSKFNKDIEVS